MSRPATAVAVADRRSATRRARSTAGSQADPEASHARRARSAPERCAWCGRQLPDQEGVGRRRQYCAQSCRQRAYENRTALERSSLPADAVVLSVDERDDLADRLYQMRCAAEDVATALAESAPRAALVELVDSLMDAARAAERIR
jgi:hypothetical protein